MFGDPSGPYYAGDPKDVDYVDQLIDYADASRG